MNGHYYRLIALFFYYALLDDKVAVRAAERAIASYKNKLRGLNLDINDAEDSRFCRAVLVRACQAQWEQARDSAARGEARLNLANGFHLPENVDLAPWVKFHKEANEEEMIALIFTRILVIDEHEIAEALGFTTGTVFHRVGRAVRLLGSGRAAAAR